VRGEGSFFARAILAVVARRESRDEGRAHRCTKSRANKSLWHRRALQTQLCNAATLSNSIYVTVARYCRPVTPARRPARVDSLGCRLPSSSHFDAFRVTSRDLSVYRGKYRAIIAEITSRSPRGLNRHWTSFVDNYLILFTELLAVSKKRRGKEEKERR